jgi:phosphatidylserine decarboxylase
MYHRFHAPVDCQLKRVIFIPGDMWNVNSAAIKRIEKLYCKNERAVLELDIGNPEQHLVVIPIAAIAVASLKLHCLTDDLDMNYQGPYDIRQNIQYGRGDEMGYFQHGSTIILLASENFSFHPAICTNKNLRMGQPVFVNATLSGQGDDNEIA